MKRINKKVAKEEIKCLYICQSPVLNGCKIGYHKGTTLSLYKRYTTSLSSKVYFFIFETENPEEHEKIVHRILKPYNISNEIFRIDNDTLIPMYCYMAKMVTGCSRIRCYSREKYGLVRNKGKWQFLKNEMNEENTLNNDIIEIEQSGIINISPDSDGGDENNKDDKVDFLTKDMDNMTMEDQHDNDKIKTMNHCEENNDMKMESDENEEEIDDIYVDNPFGKWAFRGKNKKFYKDGIRLEN